MEVLGAATVAVVVEVLDAAPVVVVVAVAVVVAESLWIQKNFRATRPAW